MNDIKNPPRQRREQQRAIDTREKIIEAAATEFALHGYEGASTRSVAESAGVRHALVTYHFHSKEGLWQAVMDRAVREFMSGQRQRLEGLRGVDDALKLRLLLEEFVRYSGENSNLHRLMTHASGEGSPQLDSMVAEYLRGYFDMIAEPIRSAQADGVFVAGDPYHLHYLFIGAATRIFMLAEEVTKVLGQSPLDPAFIDTHVDACLSLFFTEPQPSQLALQVPLLP